MHNPEYLGDGVYVRYYPTGDMELMANDHQNPTDKIFLESQVFDALLRFKQHYDKERKEEK